MGQRIRGQEVEVVMIVGGEPKTTITEIKSFEVEFELDVLKEGYLNQKADKRDEIYNGITGKMELHMGSPDVLDVVQKIVDRATRRDAAASTVQINVKASLNWPDGTRRKLTVIDASFGSIPLSFGGRAEYGSLSLSFEAETFSLRS
jgi:hypothetical protein